MCILIACKLDCDVIKSEINHLFLIKTFFIYDRESLDKNSNILKTEKAFKMK